MPATQERYIEMLMSRVRQDRYPSIHLMDRIEAAMWTSEQVHEYAELLVDKVDSDRYPSLQMLDRIQRLLMRTARA